LSFKFISFSNNEITSTDTKLNTSDITETLDIQPIPTLNKPILADFLLNHPKFEKYQSVFRKIRLQHILTDMASLRILYSDRIIPKSWIDPYYYKCWMNALFIDQEQRYLNFEVNRADFDRESIRFGRKLDDDSVATWRWVGFNNGIDLVVTHKNRSLKLKRNSNNQTSTYRGLMSNKQLYRVYFIMTAVQLDHFGNEKWHKKSELTCIDFTNTGEEKAVFSIDNFVQYPVYMNLHVVTCPIGSSAQSQRSVLNNLTTTTTTTTPSSSSSP
jgi:hypothetical protein